MLLITIFVELCVVAGRSRTWAGTKQAVSRWPHCVNQMGKTHSKPLAAWHGRGTAGARHAMCESASTVYILVRKAKRYIHPVSPCD